MKKDNKQRLFEVMERLNPDFKQDKPKLILPVGISGSGKSTWIKSQTDPNTIVISPDDIRRELTGNISDQSKNGEVWSTAFDRIIQALNAGKNVILDATNVKSGDRKRLMNHLSVNVNKPFEAVAKIFNVDPEIAKQRVKKDIEAGVDRSNVPDWAIDRQYQSFIDGLNSLEDEGIKIINNISEEENPYAKPTRSNVTFDEIKAKEDDWRANFKIITDGGMRMYIVSPYFMTIKPYRKEFLDGNFYDYGRERRFGITRGTTVERTDEEGFYKAVNVLLKRQNK